jgi:hypothetical protein
VTTDEHDLFLRALAVSVVKKKKKKKTQNGEEGESSSLDEPKWPEGWPSTLRVADGYYDLRGKCYSLPPGYTGWPGLALG